jgi:type VI secretion system secreted protein VgrG
MSQNITLSFASGESSLSVRTLDVTDRISAPFRAEILARSPSPDVDLEALVGASAAVRVSCPVLAGMVRAARVWSGVCTDARQVRVEPSGLSTYRLVIEPDLVRLSRRTNNRLFQHLTLVEMVERLLGEWQIPHVFHVDAARYPKLEVRTQFRESDLAFVHRLLEEGGISYFFDDQDGESRLVLTDAPHDGKPRLPVPFLDEPTLVAGKALPFVTGVELRITEQTGTRTLRDYDHRNPGFALFARAGSDHPASARYERYDYAAGAFVHERNPPGFTPVADDKAPQRHDLGQGQLLARTQLEAERARRRALSFSTNLLDLSPGMVFSIVDHPRHDLAVDQGLLITEYALHAEVSQEWRVDQRAAPTDVPWRPLPETPKPRIFGMQTAFVVGPPGEEIYVDELGRVRVQFPWDREGQMDDDSSSWMRVIQGWAGAGYGLINLPRVGQEVLVGFLDGDPDMPVVAGRVFNQEAHVHRFCRLAPYLGQAPREHPLLRWIAHQAQNERMTPEARLRFLEDEVMPRLIADRWRKTFEG